VKHSWGDPYRTPHRTLRTCVRCGAVKISRHDGPQPQTEYVDRHGQHSETGQRAPKCEPERRRD